MKLEYPKGATPLEPDELEGLIPIQLKTQDDLNKLEAQNILLAEEWLYEKNPIEDYLSIDFIKLLHKKMFNQTWRWAGKFRKTDKNIGVEPYQISFRLKDLLNDVISQLEFNSLQLDEIAYRFHFRLVQIHPFANGNGRHGRLMTDYLLLRNGSSPFTWGGRNLIDRSEARNRYITALRNADKHDYSALATFVRS